MNTKKLFLIFAMILLINIISASAPTLGIFKINSDIELKQTCVINGTFCDSCNISSVDYPDGSRIISDVAMTKRNGDFNYTLNSSNTGLLGSYRVNGYCDYGNDVRKTWVYYFNINPSGKNASTGDSILYSLFSLILFGVIFLLSFFVFSMPSKNEKDERGFENKILKIKYIRVFFISLIYALIILLLNFLNGLASSFLSLSIFAGILGFLFETMLRISWPFTFIMIAWIVVMLIHDSNLGKQLKKFENMDLFKNG